MGKSMFFELTICLLFGEKANHIADLTANPTHRRGWLQKAVKKLQQDVNNLDTVPHHKQRLMTELDAISALLKGVTNPSWALCIVCCAF